MKKEKWIGLRKGDIVDIVAPGMPPIKGTIPRVQNFLKSWGLVPRVAKDLIAPQIICANTKKYRLASLKSALKARDSKMVWCMRGGYGSLQLLPGLSKMAVPRQKIFMGLSDITSLHIFLQDKWGWETIHGSNVDRFAWERGDQKEIRFFKDVLFCDKKEISYPLKPLNKKALASVRISSHVTGGNLVTLQSSLGTQFEIQTRGKILFIEDIGERAYRVDRVLEHLNQAGKLKGLKAIVLGQFTGGTEPSGKKLLPQYFKNFASELSIPMFSGIPSGHGDPQRPLILGGKSLLVGGSKSKIIFQTGFKP